MSNKVGYVDAVLPREDVRFEIRRDDLQLLERGLNCSAYALFRRLAEGQWTVQELSAILSSGLWHRVKDQWQSLALRTAHYTGFGGVALPIRWEELINEGVVTALREDGPAHYVPLALKVLEAALFGIEESDAYFELEVV